MPTMNASTRQRFLQLLPLFQQLSSAAGVPWDLVAGVAWRESDFVPTAVNPNSGASGLMQIMPGHFQELGLTGGRWADPATNIRAGIQVLKWHGLGRKPIDQVLKGYGGFVTVDPRPYIRAVEARREGVRNVAAAYGGTPQEPFRRPAVVVPAGGAPGGGVRVAPVAAVNPPPQTFGAWLRYWWARWTR